MAVGQRSQLPGRFDQARREYAGVLGQAGALEQAAGGEEVEGAVEAQVQRARREAMARGPAQGGFEARREAVGRVARPGPTRRRHELTKGQQHHGTGGVRATCAHGRGQPRRQRFEPARRGDAWQLSGGGEIGYRGHRNFAVASGP